MRSPAPAAPASLCRRQRGGSLVFVLLALAGLSLAGVAMMRSSDAAGLVAGAIGFQESALKASERAIEAGIAAAVAVPDRTANHAALNYFASVETVNLEPSAARLSVTTASPVVDAQTGNTARYVVERLCGSGGAASASSCVMDGATPMYRVTSLVTGPRFVSETTQAIFTVSPPPAQCGIVTQLSVTVSGVSSQSGTTNCYHSNANLTISGALATPGLEATAAGTATYTGGGMPVTTSSSVEPRALPSVDPANHKTHARQVFKSDGTITGGGFPAAHWTWDGGNQTWILNTDYDSLTVPAGLYYFEANVEIPKKIGDALAAETLSIISERSIKISAEVHLRDFTDAGHPAATNRIFIMAGGDLELPGGSRYLDDTRSSSMSARGELKVNGSITIDANLIARNESLPAGSRNWVTENTVSGTLTQAYNGSGAGGATTATRLRWRVVNR